jgi:hypothetical protein
MNYTENILFLRKKVPNYPTESTKWLLTKVRNNDKKFMKIPPSNFKVGSFYFMSYDLSAINKSSKMEQLVPFLLVDYNPAIDSKVLWIMNLNFIPLNIKEAFFTKFLDNFNNTITNNSTKKSVAEELSLPTINYDKMWDELIKFGIDYSLREIRVELIHELYSISTDSLHLLTTQNTQSLTGVDEKKLGEIWMTKLKNESLEERFDEKKVKADYEKIVKELQETFKYLDKKLKDL